MSDVDYERVTLCALADDLDDTCLAKKVAWMCRGCKTKRIIDEARGELSEARKYIEDLKDALLDTKMKLVKNERDLDDYKLAAETEAHLYDEEHAKRIYLERMLGEGEADDE